MKRRREESKPDSAVSTSREGAHLSELLDGLQKSGAVGLENLRFGPSAACGGSLGCFGLKAFAVGDVMFSIPQDRLFGLHQSSSTPQALALRSFAAEVLGDARLVTSELLIWLHMIQSREDSQNPHYSYFNSLDKTSPSPLSWPEDLHGTALAETNLALFLVDVRASLVQHCELISAAHAHFAFKGDSATAKFLDPSINSFDNLLWARGHYLARRYPGRHAVDHSERPADCVDGREVGLEDLGVLVPVLDILNHSDTHEYLKLRVVNGSLEIVCHQATLAGEELFSNYGLLSNERLLFAYGFAVDDNEHDTVTLRPSLPPGSDGAFFLGTHYIGRGGMAGVPALLWKALAFCSGRQEFAGLFQKRPLKDGGAGEGEGEGEDEDEDESPLEIGLDEVDALLSFVQRKLTALQRADESAVRVLAEHASGKHAAACSYVSRYRRGQREVLSALLEELEEAAAGGEDEEDEEV